MKKKINTLLFDIDGTLIDSNELIISSFLYTLNEFFPNEYERDDVIPFIGPTLQETFSSLNKDKVKEMITTYRSHNQANHDLMVKQFLGVYEVLEQFYNNDFKIGAVTSKIHHMARRGLKLCNIEAFFHCVIGSDDIINPKPNPEPIFKILSELNSSPEEAIMVGDRHHDILAGKNAGIKTVGVSWTLLGRDYLSKYKPDFIIDDITELSLIISNLNKNR